MPALSRSPRRFSHFGSPGSNPAAVGTPVFLSTSVNLQPNAQGAGQNEALKNPFPDKALKITELRFSVADSRYSNSIGNTATPLASGGTVGVSLKLIAGSQQIPITNGHVPFWSLGRVVSLPGELDSVADDTNQWAYGEYCWRLADPVIIPPGAGIEAQFSNFGLAQANTLVRSSVLGYSVVPLDPNDNVRVPWASHWRAPPIYLTAGGTSQSTQTDLISPPGRGMRLNYFTGRVLRFTSSTSDAKYCVTDDSYNTGAAPLFNLITMRMMDSRGYPIVRTPALFGSAFNALSRAMDFGNRGIPIPMDTYWIAYLTQAAASWAVAGTQAQPHIAAVGSFAVRYGDLV